MLATDQAEFSRLKLRVNRLNMKEGDGGDSCECSSAGTDHIQSTRPMNSTVLNKKELQVGDYI